MIQLKNLWNNVRSLFRPTGVPPVTNIPGPTPPPAPKPIAPGNLRTSQVGIDLIKKWEGLRLETYLCSAGVPTIGYGTTRINGKRIPMGMRITVEEAEGLLRNDLLEFELYVHRLVKVPLQQNHFDALVSFVYNLGPTNFERSTLLSLVNAGDFLGAQSQFHRWNRAGGQVLRGLTRRRVDEAVLFGGLSREELIRRHQLVV